MVRKQFLLILACLVSLSTVGVAEEGPAKDVPELEALSHYVGHWDVAITSKSLPFSKGEATAEWILDGRFVQQTGSLTSVDGKSPLKITTLMTYDPKEKTYRMWSFLSNGTMIEAAGQWDAQKRTMTSIHRGGTSTTTTTANFAKTGTEEWKIVTTNEKNEVVGEFSGINTRRKK
jgi:hypothetical protein